MLVKKQRRQHKFMFAWTFCSDYEASLLRLLEKVTNGTAVEISYTGSFLSGLNHINGSIIFSRYIPPSEARDHRWRAYYPRLPIIAFYRLFPRVARHAGALCEEAAAVDIERYHYR